MEWQLIDTVYKHSGDIRSNNIVAFDFDNTLAWSDSGLIFMRTRDDWVPVVNGYILIDNLRGLITDNWTIVIFINQLENNPNFTRTSLIRLANFIEQVSAELPNFNPFIYISIADNKYRKPNRGMWDLFLNDTNLVPSVASFYCGDALGPEAINPLYRWGTFDADFARNCGLAFYTPDEIFGKYDPPVTYIVAPSVLLIMAAHESQYREFVDDFLRRFPKFRESQLYNGLEHLRRGNKIIITGERFATQAGRRRAFNMIPKQYHMNTYVLMFTRPIKPFVDNTTYLRDDALIRGYANALDVHLNMKNLLISQGQEPFDIIRIN